MLDLLFNTLIMQNVLAYQPSSTNPLSLIPKFSLGIGNDVNRLLELGIDINSDPNYKKIEEQLGKIYKYYRNKLLESIKAVPKLSSFHRSIEELGIPENDRLQFEVEDWLTREDEESVVYELTDAEIKAGVIKLSEIKNAAFLYEMSDGRKILDLNSHPTTAERIEPGMFKNLGITDFVSKEDIKYRGDECLKGNNLHGKFKLSGYVGKSALEGNYIESLDVDGCDHLSVRAVADNQIEKLPDISSIGFIHSSAFDGNPCVK